MVCLLALVHRGRRHRLGGVRCGGHVGLVGGREAEVRHQRAGHRDVAVLLDEGGRHLHDLGVVPQEAVDGPVVQGDGLGRSVHRVLVLVAIAGQGGGAHVVLRRAWGTVAPVIGRA